MVVLIIIGVLAGLIALIMLIPVGVDAGYEEGRLHLSAKVMGMLLQLYPRKPPDPDKPPKEKKPKKEKKKKEKPPGEESKPKKKRSLDFNFDEIMELLRAALHGLGRIGRKISVDRFVLRFVAAGRDPYNVAMLYGKVNAALSSLAPLCRKRFNVRDCEVRTDLDFNTEEMHLDLGFALSIRIGQVVGAVLGIGFRAVVILLRNKRRLKREAKLNPPEPADETAGAGPAAAAETPDTPDTPDTEHAEQINGNNAPSAEEPLDTAEERKENNG